MIPLEHGEEGSEPIFSVNLYISGHFSIGNTSAFVFPGQLIIIT